MADMQTGGSGSSVPFGGITAFIVVVIAGILFLLITGQLTGFIENMGFVDIEFLINDLSYALMSMLPMVGTIAAGTAGILAIFLTIVGRIRIHYREKRAMSTVLLSVAMPKDNEIFADAAEAMFAGLHSVHNSGIWGSIKAFFTEQDQFSFEIVGQPNEVTLYIAVPEDLESLLERQVYGQYSDAEIKRVEDHNIFFPGCKATFTELKKSKESAFPLRGYRDFTKEEGTKDLKNITIDTLSAVTNALTKLEDNEGAAIQILIRPVGSWWQKRGNKEIKNIHDKTKRTKDAEGEQLTNAEQEKMRVIEQSINRPGFEGIVRIVTTSPSREQAEMHKNNIISAFSQFNTVDYNSFEKKKRVKNTAAFRNYLFRWFPLFTTRWSKIPWIPKISVYNTAELATLYHLPNKMVNTPHLTWVKAKKAPAPQNVPKKLDIDGGVRLGFNSYRGVNSEVWIKRDDRRRHIYSIGKTGMGKSCLAENMIYQDIANGEGCCFLDPHGDAIEAILKFVPEHRIDDVVIFDPSDIEFPIGLNMLEYEHNDQKDFVVGEFISILYKLFADFIGPRFEHIVRNSLLAIMDNPEGGTLVEMMRIITDDEYKDACLEHVTNPLVKAFWVEEMGQQVEFHKSEMLGPVLSKFGRFVSNDMMRNIIGQTNSSINVRKIMDNQQILLVNLSKGKIGDLNCQLLGMIFVSKILMSSLSRVDMPESERKDFYLYVDEFQNFATESFATILSEARKYRLNLYVTHQYIGQLEDKIQKAVFGNVGTMMFMRVGAPDAEMVAKELKPTFEEPDVINVDKFTLYLKLLVDGVATKPFSMHTYPPYKAKQDYSQIIKQRSRQRYGRPRKEVDAEIRQRAKLDVLELL